MKYLCLAHEEEALFKAMPHEEWLALRRETLSYVESLKASGHLIATPALQSANHGVLVRVRNQRLLTTDGPFAETKEQLAGFYMLEAQDLNEAIALAEKIPPARYGSIEVRPARELVSHGNAAGGEQAI